MKKIIEIIISRGFVIGLSLVFQIGFWVLIFTAFKAYSNLLIAGMILLSFFCVLHIVIKNIYPEHKIAWILFMVMFPVAGGMFYLVFGNHKESKKTKILREKVEYNLTAQVKKLYEFYPPQFVQAHSRRQSDYLRTIANAPAFKNTSVQYFPLGEDMLESMLSELEKAEKFIFIESFIIEEGKMWNSIEKILIEKAKIMFISHRLI